jgi:hypothetical protein
MCNQNLINIAFQIAGAFDAPNYDFAAMEILDALEIEGRS